MSRKPIEHVPTGSDMQAANDPAQSFLHRVTATVEWSDGATTEHKALTNQWTRTHVRVSFRIPIPSRYRASDHYKIWLLADQVRRNDRRPELGEIIPAPEVDKHTIREASQQDVNEWPRQRQGERESPTRERRVGPDRPYS